MRLWFVWVLFGIWACSPAQKNETPAQETDKGEFVATSQEHSSPDSGYANVYQPWDGHWQGTFSIYLDPRGQQASGAQPRITQKAYLDSLPLELSSELKVEQFYRSTSPFYQEVRIIDTYADGQKVESSGYNVVRGDSLICVVNKPDEQVVHLGSIPADSTIIWGRDLREPTKVEYFYEKVEGNTYSILGWGYYGNDDPEKSPRMWFFCGI